MWQDCASDGLIGPCSHILTVGVQGLVVSDCNMILTIVKRYRVHQEAIN